MADLQALLGRNAIERIAHVGTHIVVVVLVQAQEKETTTEVQDSDGRLCARSSSA